MLPVADTKHLNHCGMLVGFRSTAQLVCYNPLVIISYYAKALCAVGWCFSKSFGGIETQAQIKGGS